jgi:hypothetical protein
MLKEGGDLMKSSMVSKACLHWTYHCIHLMEHVFMHDVSIKDTERWANMILFFTFDWMVRK